MQSKLKYLFILAPFFAHALSDPIVRPPTSYQTVEESKSEPKSAFDWYERAIKEIQEGKFTKAKKSLNEALKLDPSLIVAQIQLAYLDLWENQLDSSYEEFSQVLNTSFCNKIAIEGYREIGDRWKLQNTKTQKLIQIYRTLNTCEPNNPDNLYYLGRFLAQNGNWEEAEADLKKCLQLAPQYTDAAIQLGYLYLWEGKENEAKAEFEKYPDNPDAQKGLAKIAKNQGDLKTAKQHYESVLSKNPKDREAKEAKARILHENMEYSSAETEFGWLIDDNPNESNYWNEMYDIRSHTHLGFLVDGFFTNAKENDPSLGVPVVKDYYFLESAHFLVPIFDSWKLDLKQIYYHQRENDIYPPVGVNYSMYLTGGQITSSYFFAKNWKWDLSARTFQAWGTQLCNYPFRKTTRFEPGTGISYSSEEHLFSFDVHRESFLIKNFDNFTSNLLATDYISTGYIYRSKLKLRPELEAAASYVFIQDSISNKENAEKGVIRCGIPFIEKYLIASYRFDHSHFNKLNQNYYSYKQQLKNTIGAKLHIEFTPTIFWDTTYEHGWKTTYQLFQPIGNFIFVAQRQYLAINAVTSSISARYKDKMQLRLEGHYYHDTLPYRDWNINGSFLWQF